ncbi:MAG: chemotaxis protein CheC [Defluviitaleaceae bacterium]|nr:chemotaxis protein CheC [Defluviitaleaceae bacterium]
MKDKKIDSIVEEHVDILKEIASIGCGNAVTALSSLLNRRVKMSVPVVNMLDFKDVSNCIGGAENIIAGVLVGLSGDINGIMMFIVDEDIAHRFVDMLLGKPTEPHDGFSEIEYSALTEVGNILTSSYLSSLASLTRTTINQSVPQLSIDMANAILSVPAIEFGKVGDKVLFIESVFETDTENVSGYFILVPDMPSFEVIFKSLGVM